MLLLEASKIKELIMNSENIVLFSHVNPDGDAIGSLIAMQNFIEKLGKPVNAIVPSSPMESLMFLDGVEKIHVFIEEACKELIQSADLYICLDFNDVKRITVVGEFLNDTAKTILIDHHQDPKIKFDAAYFNTDSNSTCELLYGLMQEIQPEIMNRRIATAVYTGILTDTGCFQYERTTANTFLTVSKLMEYNIDIVNIADAIFNQNNFITYKLLSKALDKFEIYCDGKFAIMRVTLDDFKETQATIKDTESFTWYLLSIKGVKAGVLISDNLEKEGEFRCSFRSKDGYEIRSIASMFGGGGHNQASGARISGIGYEELKQQIINEFSKQI